MFRLSAIGGTWGGPSRRTGTALAPLARREDRLGPATRNDERKGPTGHAAGMTSPISNLHVDGDGADQLQPYFGEARRHVEHLRVELKQAPISIAANQM